MLFGGDNNGSFTSATWTWSGLNWTQLTPATSPAGRDSAAGTYDPATGQLVIFGGRNSGGILSDTWNWDGTNWTQLSPATSPTPRFSASIGDDALSGQAILFGGFSTTFLNDTWEWDGTTWTQLFPANSPPARAGAVMAFDAVSGNLVLFSGNGSGGAVADTWTWNGTNWTQQFPSRVPLRVSQAPRHTMPQRASSCSSADSAAVGRLDRTRGRGIKRRGRSTCRRRCLQAARGAAWVTTHRPANSSCFGGFSSSSGFLNDTWSSP